MPNGDDCGDTNGSRCDYFLKRARVSTTAAASAQFLQAAGLFAIAAAIEGATAADRPPVAQSHYYDDADISCSLRDIPPSDPIEALTTTGARRCQSMVRRGLRQCNGLAVTRTQFCGRHKEWK